jgi:hypothetical protein
MSEDRWTGSSTKSEQARDLLQWLLAVVEEAEPFSVVEKPWFRRNCRLFLRDYS